MNESTPPASSDWATAQAVEKTGFHTAAAAAVVCLLVSFAVSFAIPVFERPGLVHSGMGAVILVVDAAAGLLMLASVVLGIVALCGIPRHGPRGLLWRGLFSVLLPVLLLALAVPAFVKVRRRAEELRRQRASHRVVR